MNNLDKYNSAFIETFNLKADQLNEELKYQSVPEWDSVGHMGLIANLEDNFNIMIETEDIIDFGSYVKGKEILVKYAINFEN